MAAGRAASEQQFPSSGVLFTAHETSGGQQPPDRADDDHEAEHSPGDEAADRVNVPSRSDDRFHRAVLTKGVGELLSRLSSGEVLVVAEHLVEYEHPEERSPHEGGSHRSPRRGPSNDGGCPTIVRDHVRWHEGAPSELPARARSERGRALRATVRG